MGRRATGAEAFVGQTAADLGRAMARGALDPVAFAEILLDRIDEQPSPVFLATTRGRALNEARASTQRLAAGRPLSALDGVPIAWKDLFDLRSEVTTAASEIRQTAPPAAADAPVVGRASAAGLVSLGKLNLTEFAYSGLGLNPHFGTPINPHDPEVPRSPGGSSSGCGVAVASALVPIAIGSDTGGSVRIPAAFNGVVGYKCSEGRIDRTGVFALSQTLDTIGPLARSVEDCVLVDAILRGVVNPEARPITLQHIRLFVPETVVLDDLDADVSKNFEAALDRLEAEGAVVARGPLPEFAEMARLSAEIGTITAAEAYAEHRDLVDGAARSRIDRRVVSRIDAGKRLSAADLTALLRAREAAMASLRDRLGGALLAMPTTPLTAPEIAPLEADDDLFHRTNLKALRNTSLGNILNLPGVAIPNGTDAKGLPTSFLLSACGGEDARLLGAALSTETTIRG